MPRFKKAYRRYKPRPLSDLEANLLKKLCHGYGAEDEFDWESVIDPTLEYRENVDLVNARFGFSCISESQYESTYDDYAEMADAYNAEARARYEAEEAEQPEIEIPPAIQPDSPVIQVTPHPSWFKRVYLPTASGEWLPVWIGDATKRAIEIPVTA